MADETDEMVAIAEVMYRLGETAQDEVRQTPQYQELASCSTVSALIDMATHQMLLVVHDTSDILRARGETVDARARAILKVLPLLTGNLRAAFQAQTSMGCADRALSVAARMVTDPEASVTLLMERPVYCTGSPSFCPEHGWGAHDGVTPDA